jgi:hypothetical protein
LVRGLVEKLGAGSWAEPERVAWTKKLQKWSNCFKRLAH